MFSNFRKTDQNYFYVANMHTFFTALCTKRLSADKFYDVIRNKVLQVNRYLTIQTLACKGVQEFYKERRDSLTNNVGQTLRSFNENKANCSRTDAWTVEYDLLSFSIFHRYPSIVFYSRVISIRYRGTFL